MTPSSRRFACILALAVIPPAAASDFRVTGKLITDGSYNFYPDTCP